MSPKRFSVIILVSLGLFFMSWTVIAASMSASQLQILNSLSSDQKAKIAGIAAGKSIAPQTANLTSPATPKNIPEAKIKQNTKIVESALKESLLGVGSNIIVYFNKKVKEKSPEYIPDYPQQLFQLGRFGEIEISGIGRIILAGLTEKQAAARINLEPLLNEYKIEVLRLPVQKFGVAELVPYGYELFNQMPEQMAPYTGMPVPEDYIVGPGDQIHIQLLGKENQEYLLEVSRDSSLSLPGIGVFPVSGLQFDELKRDLKKRIKKQFIGVDAFITLGQLRSIRVFVLGEVNNPGAYSVSGLATMTNALMFGEGITDIGSLRQVTLKRSGKLSATLDLYKLLLEGDTRDDKRLRPGDVIHVPPVKRRISISGEIRRPAIYELNNENALSEIIDLAGGLLPSASQRNIKLVRIEGREKKLIELDLHDVSSSKFKVHAGDVITIDAVLDRQENAVHLKGAVLRTSEFQWTPALKLLDLIPNKRVLKSNADTDYVVIKRYLPPEFDLDILSSNLTEAFAKPTSQHNIKLVPRDEVVVLDLSDKRILQINPIIDQLVIQSDSTVTSRIVRVNGMIRGPGNYPLTPGMRISDLVYAGGRLAESAYTLEAELTRFIAETGKPREIKHLKINLQSAMSGSAEDNLLLEPYDLLSIKEIPLWQEEDHVELIGEVSFPGNYAIQRGETLTDLLRRAGGVTEFAYPQGAVFIREDLRKREQERLDVMAANLEAELATISLQRSGDPTKIQSAGTANQLLSKLKGTAAAGRLVIDLPNIIEDESSDKKNRILVRGGDKLYIPSHMQEVSVIGQVYHPTSHLFNEDLSVDDYIGLSGGMSRSADEDSIYVVRANGAVQAANSGWVEDDFTLLPGDTVVVPLDADRVSTLKLWTDVSQIVYQLGLSAAAWNTVGLFN